jgi:hypothetical protein
MGLEVLVEHRPTWNAKPGLADIYAVWFEALLDTLGSSHHHVLELGAGRRFSASRSGRVLSTRSLPWTSCITWPSLGCSSKKRRASSRPRDAWR